MWNLQEKKRVVQLPASSIVPNPAQPRQEFQEEELRDLADSIQKNGLLQPILVRRIPGGYELIAGERRLRACRLAGLASVPCLINDCDSRQSAIFAMLENLQRKDLGVFEEAEGIRRLVEEWGVTQEEAAARLGKSQSSIANKLRLLRLSPEERQVITSAGLTERHARALIRLEDPSLRAAALQVIAERGLNVAQTDQYIASLLQEDKPQDLKKPRRTILVRDVRIFLNTIHHAIEMMKQNGIQAQSLKQETEDYFEYVVRIPKNTAGRLPKTGS